VGVGPDGGRFATGVALAAFVATRWPADAPKDVRRFVVCTGGEPLLQLDRAAIDGLHAQGFEIAVETNGTQAAPAGIDWVCVSPKAEAPLVLTVGDELKLVYPQITAMPERFAALNFRYFLLQPMDGPDVVANTAVAVAYCLANPRWRMSVQTHKALNIR